MNAEQTKSDNMSRTRRHIFITDDYYKEVAKEAIDENVDYGRIIDKALKQYFDKKQKA